MVIGRELLRYCFVILHLQTNLSLSLPPLGFSQVCCSSQSGSAGQCSERRKPWFNPFRINTGARCSHETPAIDDVRLLITINNH